MEDYKEKYEMALERARDSFNYPDFPGFIRADVVFPELKESEDEKIRKAILELVRQSSEVLDKQNQNNMIAWLEKQGNQNHIEQNLEMVEALRTEYEKGRADVIADTISWLANCWPQYCNNPTIIDGFKEAMEE